MSVVPLDPDDSRAPYLQIADELRQAMRSGELLPGKKLPSGAELSARYGVARMTAQQAIRVLRNEGWVTSQQGRGVFVRERTKASSPQDHVLAIKQTGRINPPDGKAKILGAELVPAPKHVAKALGVEPGSDVVKRRRATFRGNDQVSLSTSWFTKELADAAPLLLKAQRMPEGTPAYIEKQTGRSVVRGMDRLVARVANQVEADDLGLPVGSAILCGENRFFDEDGAVIEFGEYMAAGDRGYTYEYALQ